MSKNKKVCKNYDSRTMSKNCTNGNQMRNNRKGQKRNDDQILSSDDRTSVSKRNDYSWYSQFPEFTAYAGTVPFGKPLGTSFDLSVSGSTAHDLHAVLPGIMTIGFVPTPGYSANRGSAINRAAMRWYTYMRNAQKASGDYDSQDMMMAFLALDSAYMFHAFLKRILGVANLPSPLNRYAPEGMLRAMGVDPIDVRNNIDDLWGYINKFAIDLGSVCMPADIDFRMRHEWMCSGIYTDGNDVRSQMYIFVPEGFWYYNNTVQTGSELDWLQYKYVPGYSGSPYTIANLKQIGNSIINAILGDEDLGLISGDILNAIGPDRVVKLSETPRDYAVVPSYNEMVLSQIENSSAFGYFAADYTPKITQDPSINNGAIIFEPQMQGYTNMAPAYFKRKFFLNFHHANPSVEDVIEATRLTMQFTTAISAQGVVSPTAFGTEICVQYTLWTASATNPLEYTYETPFGSAFEIKVDDVTLQSAQYLGRMFTKLASFDWHPHIGVFVRQGDTAYYTGELFDSEVTTLLEPDQLANMHEAAITSEFNLPQMGFTNR